MGSLLRLFDYCSLLGDRTGLLQPLYLFPFSPLLRRLLSVISLASTQIKCMETWQIRYHSSLFRFRLAWTWTGLDGLEVDMRNGNNMNQGTERTHEKKKKKKKKKS